MQYNKTMHLILTHEQADFDALAAMLGAHLMNERAIPVLPKRMNRNCRSFIHLYGAELPFVEAADLPAENIESITLVDTQSLVTLKGMTHNTAVYVIDHHGRRPDLPENWSVTIDNTGACTTLFIEGLREHNGLLTPIQATLLLLGIYEDTGSLTYHHTTPRDARAVAYLLEQGAGLQIATGYLNPALSSEQRAVYDRLLAAAETHEYQGLTVVLATANAEGLNEEISSIAHKLRDLLDPAALFLFVRTMEGLRLVARSTTDRIDVSGVAAHFGGGGHNRASAALVRVSSGSALAYQEEGEEPIAAARRELLRILPEHIRPSTTVRQIMSRHPILLSPDTPAEKAAHLMTRYGFEGYPVVKDGKVIGLLNRRAVDRAVSHRLNLPAASLMEAGEITVRTDDSLERLREVMVSTGWGQVPVIDPQSGQVVGIVTRTDLLKHGSEQAPLPGRTNLAQHLEKAMPPARLALLKAIAAEARHLRQGIYIVGGFVRDLLLDRPSLDFDIVVEGDAIALARGLEQRFGGRILAHSRFGTAKWTVTEIRPTLAEKLGDGPFNAQDIPESLDLISARTEFYDYPTALPTVERSSIKLDLHRRDFTFNTLALRLDGHHYGDLYDYWGGLRDLRQGLVRVLHSLSFVDDPTRQLRAVRFEQRFGFKIEQRTLQLMDEGIPLMRNVSGDRLRHEINLVLQEERALAMLHRLEGLGLLAAIQPDLRAPTGKNARLAQDALTGRYAADWTFPEKFAGLPSRLALAYLFWLLQLNPETFQATAERLHLPGTLIETLADAAALLRDLPALASAVPSQITARLDSVSPQALYAVFNLTDDAQAAQHIQTYHHTWSKTWPPLTGDDLRPRNIPPGPAYRAILSKLRAAWLDGQLKDAAGEQILLEQLITEYSA